MTSTTTMTITIILNLHLPLIMLLSLFTADETSFMAMYHRLSFVIMIS